MIGANPIHTYGILTHPGHTECDQVPAPRPHYGLRFNVAHRFLNDVRR